MLATEGNGTRPRIYLYDRNDPDGLTLLSEAHPDLERIVEPTAVTYPARDGLTIPAYLTVPPDRRPGERLPVVILVQDAPWPTDLVDTWAAGGIAAGTALGGMPKLRGLHRFDVWSQFLVSRGYAVLQATSRGSGGYGDRFLTAGFGEWGQAMQHDLVDGLDWLIAQGIADPHRVCIAGGGYGGYAALVAAYQTPERFRCAVSFAGVTDLDALTRRWHSAPSGTLAAARVQAGRSARESSPLHQVEKIDVPLLIVHGDLDRSVTVDHSRDLVNALDAAGKPHRYIEQRGGDHYLSLESHRAEVMQALDEFFDTHLAGTSTEEHRGPGQQVQ